MDLYSLLLFVMLDWHGVEASECVCFVVVCVLFNFIHSGVFYQSDPLLRNRNYVNR